MNNFYNFDLIGRCHKLQESQKVITLSISTNDDNILHNQKVVPCYCYCCLILHFVI